MRALFAIGVVLGSSVWACSGGAGPDLYNLSDQTAPPTDSQQAPINTQVASVDPQAAPPVDRQSVAPTDGGLGAVSNAPTVAAICAAGCSPSRCPEISKNCEQDCREDLTSSGPCTGDLLAAVRCFLASPGYMCSLKAKDLPAECAGVYGAYVACALTVESSDGTPLPPPVKNGKGNGAAGAATRL